MPFHLNRGKASPAGEAAIRAAIAGDMLTAARYRLPD